MRLVSRAVGLCVVMGWVDAFGTYTVGAPESGRIVSVSFYFGLL